MSYQIVCLKCNQAFVSEDEADADGEGFCATCKENSREIAEKVDAILAVKKANKMKDPIHNVYEDVRKKRKGSLTYMNI